MNKTRIECFNYAWNTNCGCSKDGCPIPHCWAEAMGKRQKHHCLACYSFQPHLHKERFREPLKSRAKEGLVAVGLMGEFFDKQLSMPNWRQEVYNIMEATPWFIYFILTKQPQNIPFSDRFPRNLYIGVTVNHQRDVWRIDTLLSRIADVSAFVFFEPLYENINVDLTGISWVVIGAQSKPSLQPKPEWISNLMNQARIFGAKIFLKNNLNPQPTVNRIQEFPKEGEV